MTLSDYERVADHEASHGAAAVVLGFPVTEIWIGAAGGLMSGVQPTDTHADLRSNLMITLAPLVEEGDQPAWPPNPHAAQQDEREVAALVTELGLNKDGYRQVVAETIGLTEKPRYKRLRTGISHALLTFGPVLNQHQLNSLIKQIDPLPIRPKAKPTIERKSSLITKLEAKLDHLAIMAPVRAREREWQRDEALSLVAVIEGETRAAEYERYDAIMARVHAREAAMEREEAQALLAEIDCTQTGLTR